MGERPLHGLSSSPVPSGPNAPVGAGGWVYQANAWTEQLTTASTQTAGAYIDFTPNYLNEPVTCDTTNYHWINGFLFNDPYVNAYFVQAGMAYSTATAPCGYTHYLNVFAYAAGGAPGLICSNGTTQAWGGLGCIGGSSPFNMSVNNYYFFQIWADGSRIHFLAGGIEFMSYSTTSPVIGGVSDTAEVSSDGSQSQSQVMNNPTFAIDGDFNSTWYWTGSPAWVQYWDPNVQAAFFADGIPNSTAYCPPNGRRGKLNPNAPNGQDASYRVLKNDGYCFQQSQAIGNPG